jgi:hypothetical protein
MKKSRYTITGNATQRHFDELVRANPAMYSLRNTMIIVDGTQFQELIVETTLDLAAVTDYFSEYTVRSGCIALGY